MPLKKFIPARLRIWLVRLVRWPGAARAWKHCSRERGGIEQFSVILSEHKTPLQRDSTVSGDACGARLQQGKVQNLRVASAKLNQVVVHPGETFSYHALVGWPGRWRGFRPGLELRGGELKEGIGGGCCALSNLLYLIAIRAGLQIKERHRHGLNMFPDHGRTVPFGCGATVFFPYADLKFFNPFPNPVLLEVTIDDNYLIGRVLTSKEPGFRFSIEERDHRFEKRGEKWFRENRIVRIKEYVEGEGIRGEEEEIAVNQGLCLYDPELAGETSQSQ